jgi:hypothetical protein
MVDTKVYAMKVGFIICASNGLEELARLSKITPYELA